jgi:Reverse transcriptase (RNA-dependent DNA polymerase)
MEQFGFRAMSSCEQALISATGSWMEDVDKGQFVGALLLDLSKAFDTVPHQLLLHELSGIGCDTNTTAWFRSYLEDRQQRVVATTQVTDWREVTRGVPQGSCLSPLLFNIFVRELPSAAQARAMQFADDVSESEADNNPLIIAKKLAECFNKTKGFCDSHELILNSNKTQLIVFQAAGKKLPADFEVVLDGCHIKASASVKLLGLTLDRHLTFGEHIDNVIRKCHGLIGVLARAAPYLSRDLRRLVYVSLIRSHLEYCSAIFASASPSQLKKLDTIQRIASRIICGVPRDAHSAPLMLTLQLEPLEKRRSEHITNLANSMITGRCHPALRNVFTLLADGTISNDLQSRIGVGRRRFGVYAKQVYNSDIGSC